MVMLGLSPPHDSLANAALRLSFSNGAGELLDGPRDLRLGDHSRRSQKNVITSRPIDTALHGINQESSLESSRPDSRRKVFSGREGTFRRLVCDELDSPQQPDPPNITD